MKKVISFGLWGDAAKYLVGAVENAKLVRKVYPGWVARFTVDKTVRSDIVRQLQDLGAEVHLMPHDTTFKPRFWRIEVAFDRYVARFLCRDCDSRLNARGADAVREWEESGLPVHIMRDHYRHTAPIMGGMWGAVHGFIPDFARVYDAWIRRLRSGWRPTRIGVASWSDQPFLRDAVWPLIKDNHLGHDDKKRKTGIERRFRVKLPKGDFVGKIVEVK